MWTSPFSSITFRRNVSSAIWTPSGNSRLTTIRLQRRHLRRDAGIQPWMRASLPCRPGICMEILAARPLASAVRCAFVDDAAVQAERDHAVVAQLPDPSLWVPRPTGLLHPVAHGHVGKGDA